MLPGMYAIQQRCPAGHTLHRRPVQHKVDRPMRVSATARPPSHPPTRRQFYKPDEGIALTNEQRVAPYIMMNE